MTDEEMKAPHPQCPEEICGRQQERRKCTLCESLEERDKFWAWRTGRVLASWVIDTWDYIASEKGYRIVVPVVATVIGAYVGVYAIVEARHERQLSRALFAQNRFLTLTASGSPGGLNAALAEYETLKSMTILEEPDFRWFWKWGENTRKENEEVLKRWAQKFFRGCPANWCGQGLDLTVLGNGDLERADLVRTNLQGANLTEANLQKADLREAILWKANLQKADLRGANLQKAGLSQANLQGANLKAVKGLTQDQLEKACMDDTTTLPEGITLTPLSPSLRMRCAKVWPDSFKP